MSRTKIMGRVRLSGTVLYKRRTHAGFLKGTSKQGLCCMVYKFQKAHPIDLKYIIYPVPIGLKDVMIQIHIHDIFKRRV